MFSEQHLIESITKKSHGFIGDDAAVIPLSDTESYVITTDMLINNTHFQCDKINAHELAHKSLHVNLSDLAAMGAKPYFILCAISIPNSNTAYATSFMKNLQNIADNNGIILIGGDTCKSDTLTISITAIGKANTDQIAYRHTANESDLICIAGNLGYAHLGWQAQEKNIPVDDLFSNSFNKPTAKIKEGIWLSQHEEITSMMDLSDGLSLDLKKLAECSGLKACIELDTLAFDPLFTNTCRTLNINPLHAACSGGEDYSLLFTCKKGAFTKIKNAFSSCFSTPLYSIGYTQKGSGLSWIQNNSGINPCFEPFTHFGEKA